MPNDEVLQATLLLSCYFNKNEVRNIKPLTPTEYSRFALWLHQNKLTPASLLHNQTDILAKWQDPKKKITPERIDSLLSRGVSMGFALERWEKHGIWVVSRASVSYPKLIREKIGDTRPPIFFGVGEQALLNKQGIGFVGSRSINTTDESFSKNKAALAVSQGYVVISGGAKGVDQAAMLSALACGGEAVGILSDNLLKASVNKIYREGIKTNKLALISPYYPEASFNTGNAMGRNKYIYALSQAVVVVKSDADKGGTWAGGIENLKKQWVPLLVRSIQHDGNQNLIKLGGIGIDETFNDFNKLANVAIQQPELATEPANSEPKEGGGSILEKETDDLFFQEQPAQKDLKSAALPSQDRFKTTSNEGIELDGYGEIFNLFYKKTHQELADKPFIRPDDLKSTFPELPDSLIKKWLKELEGKNCLSRQGRKLIYTLPTSHQNKGACV